MLRIRLQPTNIAVLCCALAASAVAQDTVTVDGVVVNKVTGSGIGGATVRVVAPAMLGQPNTDHYETITDDTGTFRISGIKPGDYGAYVERNGYFRPDGVTIGSGGTQRFRGGDSIRLRFELIPPAVIRGRVVGTDGNPAQASVDLGRGRTVSTGADGSFVFENLEPGRYTLLARPKLIEPIKAHDGRRTEVVRTYYPSAVVPTQAEAIVVRAGAELNGYEIRLQSVPVYRVRGTVLDPDGKPAPKAVVELHAGIAGGDPDQFFFHGGASLSFSIRTGEMESPEIEEPFVTNDDGVFEFPSVRGGDWTIRAEGDPPSESGLPSVGAATFSLGHGDPDDLKIRLAARFSLSGVALLSDGSPPPPGVMVAVRVFSETGHSESQGPPGGSNSIRIAEVIPGAHEIRAEVLYGNYYPASILLGSTDVTAQRVELTSSSPPIKVILKPAATIRGTVEDADDRTVVLFPQSVTGTAYSGRSGRGKTFALEGIPPGEYYAIALDHFDPRTMADAIHLRSLMPLATSVKVESGSTASVQLKVHRVGE